MNNNILAGKFKNASQAKITAFIDNIEKISKNSDEGHACNRAEKLFLKIFYHDCKYKNVKIDSMYVKEVVKIIDADSKEKEHLYNLLYKLFVLKQINVEFVKDFESTYNKINCNNVFERFSKTCELLKDKYCEIVWLAHINFVYENYLFAKLK